MGIPALKTNLKLAIEGGVPVRTTLLPYGKQWIDEADIAAVTRVLKSHWLTTGPTVEEFEKALCAKTKAKFATTVSNGTAGLHAALHAAGVKAGDEVIVPSITFVASANAVLFVGGTPVLADVNPGTLLLDAEEITKRITAKTKAIVCVDYAGQPCEFEAIQKIAKQNRLTLIVDACHSLGASYRGNPVGTLGDMTVLSFHPVKQITTGEGGAVLTNDETFHKSLRAFRSHGIVTDAREREKNGTFFYSADSLGYNFRLSDIQCALGLSQLDRLETFVKRRQSIAQVYSAAFRNLSWLRPLDVRREISHAYHLYVIRLNLETLSGDRDALYSALRAEGIGVNVHYIPVHLHPLYERMGYRMGQFPNAEAAYKEILTLPLFPAMTDDDVDSVICAVTKVCSAFSR